MDLQQTSSTQMDIPMLGTLRSDQLEEEEEDQTSDTDRPRLGIVNFSTYTDLIGSMTEDPIDQIVSIKKDKKSQLGICKKTKQRKKSKKFYKATKAKKRMRKINNLSEEIINQLDLNKHHL